MNKLNITKSMLNDFGLLFLRLGIGLSYFAVHGLPKISGGPERWERIGNAVSYFGIEFVPGLWGLLAAIAETGGGILIILGFVFRPALLMVIITMIVAATQHLAKGDPFSKAAYPMEMAVVLIALFIFGPGRYSLQHYFSFKKSALK